MTKHTYMIIEDGQLWGVIDETETLINEKPISLENAIKLKNEMSEECVNERYADELPDSDFWGCYND